jgi:hypothetical protein
MVSILASGSDTARSRRCRCRDLIPTVDGSSVTGVEVVDPRWEPWSPAEVARRLADVDAAWCVAAGWALDLWRGRQTREHEDIEIAVPAAGFPEIRRALAGYEADFTGALPMLGAGQRAWLREALARVAPAHEWAPRV